MSLKMAPFDRPYTVSSLRRLVLIFNAYRYASTHDENAKRYASSAIKMRIFFTLLDVNA